MEISTQELNRKRLYSAGITAVVIGLLSLFLVAYNIVSPHLQFQNGNTTPSQEFALSVLHANSSQNDFNFSNFIETAREEAISVVKHAEPVVPKPLTEDAILNAKSIATTYSEKQNKKHVQTETVTTEAENLTSAASPTIEGHETITTKRTSRFICTLSGRKIEKIPQFKQPSTEEGTVVVDITVNAAGEVIEATATGRGSTTTNADLINKAIEAARGTKFSADNRFEEQKGTITVVFSYQ